jgi:uracil-DNA glycosylase
MIENSPAFNMINIIETIRNCNLNCYTNRYTSPLPAKNRTIRVDELIRGKPLIDDWRDQKVIFISQAPSKTAWADHELSTLNNSFFKDFLLPKIFPDLRLDESLEIWRKIVFWTHTSNCYPGKLVDADGDEEPNSICSDEYLDQIIDNMNPKLIVLMGLSATKFFDTSLRELIGSKKAPSLKEIINWQKENQSTLLIKSKNGNSKYKAVAIYHAAYRYWKGKDLSKFGFELANRLILDIYIMISDRNLLLIPFF